MKNDSIAAEVGVSWREGNLILRREPLGEVTVELSRVTSVEFIFRDDELKKIKIAGLFEVGDVDGFLRSLQDNFNIVYRRVRNRKVILSHD